MAGDTRTYEDDAGLWPPASLACPCFFVFLFFFLPRYGSVTFLGRHSDGAGVDSLLVARSRKRHPRFVSTTDDHNRLRRSTVHHGNYQSWTSAPRHSIQPPGLLAFFFSAFNSRIDIFREFLKELLLPTVEYDLGNCQRCSRRASVPLILHWVVG